MAPNDEINFDSFSREEFERFMNPSPEVDDSRVLDAIDASHFQEA